MFTKLCRYCGAKFEVVKRNRLYCSDRCRRKYQDERRLAERAEYRAAKKARKKWQFDLVFDDPDRPEIYGNSLSSGIWEEVQPCGFTVCQHEAVGGPIACQDCPLAL